MRIVRDETRNSSNREKHGVSFEEAQALLERNEGRLDIFDEARSALEDRFNSIGIIARGLVVLVWTERCADEQLRFISAGWATKREAALYHSHMRG